MTKARFDLIPKEKTFPNIYNTPSSSCILSMFFVAIRIRLIPLKYNNPSGADNGENI